ncbi:MAG TPA: hypothetical protein VMT61_11050 [Candidatus Binataceae bacterium]|nr:hypothetical protein [Candidatus Binataceae bacterium]
MKPEGQDRAIAAAMKGQYRAASASPGPDCADVETVAAFLDRTLSSNERTRWEAHIAGCPYCTSLLGTAARAAHAAPRDVPARTRWWLLPALSSIVAATTTALFLYVRAMNNRVAATPVELAEKSADLAYRASEAKPEEAARPPAKEAAPTEARDQLERYSEPREVLKKAKPEREYRELAKSDVQSETAGSEVRNESASVGAGANAPRAQSDSDMVAAAPASAPAIGGAIGGVANVAESQDEKRASRVPASLRWAAEITTPDGAVRWRVGKGGAIEHFSAGNVWAAQSSGVRSDLSAGSAPSAGVCWVVGRHGIVLRTTDDEHWEKRASPVTIDLTAVSAESSEAATVTAADGHRYATTDGGASWHQL